MADVGPRDWVDVLAQPIHTPGEQDRCLARVALAAAAWRRDAADDLHLVLDVAGLS